MERNDIILIHGTNYKEMAIQVLEAASLSSDIGDTGKKIGLKPNLVTASPPENGATTHSEITAGALEYLQAHGFKNIEVMEGAWVGEGTARAVKATGYDSLCRRYNVPFIDLQKDGFREYDSAGMKIRLCNHARAVDYMINLPVLKGHCQTAITCALKNNKGVIPNQEKRRFHSIGLHKPIAHLNTVARNDFILVDNICGDLDFEEGGNPVVMNRILGFKDPVLCDSFVCSCLGYATADVAYIPLAEKLGVGSSDLSKARYIYLNHPTAEAHIPMTRRVKRLASFAAPRQACSACYGSLIYALSRLEDEGLLKKNKPPIAIGQGYRTHTAESGIPGIGRCCAGCEKSLPGCPPRAADIVSFLKENWC